MRVFHVFLSCTNGTKSRNAPHISIFKSSTLNWLSKNSSCNSIVIVPKKSNVEESSRGQNWTFCNTLLFKQNLNNFSVAFSRILFDPGIDNKCSAKLCVSTLYRNFYRLLIVTFIDHWVPRMIFVYLIN